MCVPDENCRGEDQIKNVTRWNVDTLNVKRKCFVPRSSRRSNVPQSYVRSFKRRFNSSVERSTGCAGVTLELTTAEPIPGVDYFRANSGFVPTAVSLRLLALQRIFQDLFFAGSRFFGWNEAPWYDVSLQNLFLSGAGTGW